ncbi:DoxX family protein [Fibrella sp. HMF5335]|uniref:DoxX family protein n=1 Tax=Fibrella rubiginis TaxID=2817060 RepID=A0A939K3L1_9BACT|nr:DoxX family protein [Fibrella rubiginis]MBO0935246.1 DoxX family protein [Fibrella rubiginis]
MTTNQRTAKKSKHIGYWVVTGLLLFGMVAGGIAQISHVRVNVDGMIRLGYPLYTMRLLGIWKLAGAVVLIIPGYGLVKEWAYAGFFFLLTGAVMSHIASGDAFFQWVAPLTFAILTVISWYLRPANRRLASTTDTPSASFQATEPQSI